MEKMGNESQTVSIRCRFCGRHQKTFKKMYDHAFHCQPGTSGLYIASQSSTIHPDSLFDKRDWWRFCEDCRIKIRSTDRAIYTHLWRRHHSTQAMQKYLLDIAILGPREIVNVFVEIWSYDMPEQFELLSNALEDEITIDKLYAKTLL